MYSNSLLLILSLIVVGGFCGAPCDHTWECISVSTDYNFVQCSDGECVCKSELGFDGSATAEDKCRCEWQVYWGVDNPHCKRCEEPKEIIYRDGFPYCVDVEHCEALTQEGDALGQKYFPLESLVRARCSTDPAQQVFVGWTGSAYSFVNNEAQRNVFNFVGMNVARCFPNNIGGFTLASREVMIYTDPATGSKLVNWTNPWTQEEVAVVHVANDPVVQTLYPGSYPAVITNSMATFVLDIPLFYPNPLGNDPTFEEYSPQPWYLAGEFFKFTALQDDISNPSLNQTSTLHLSWFRESPWLPWMKNGDREGHLLFSGFGGKVENFEGLPELVKAEILEHVPVYSEAPSEVPTEPNESSWTYFRDHFEEYLQFQEFPLP